MELERKVAGGDGGGGDADGGGDFNSECRVGVMNVVVLRLVIRVVMLVWCFSLILWYVF